MPTLDVRSGTLTLVLGEPTLTPEANNTSSTFLAYILSRIFFNCGYLATSSSVSTIEEYLPKNGTPSSSISKMIGLRVDCKPYSLPNI